MNLIKKVLEIKEMRNLISIMECVIKFHVSSIVIIYFNSKKNIQKTQKNPYIKNGELEIKNSLREDVKLIVLLTCSITFNLSSLNII